MFTGIIEKVARVKDAQPAGTQGRDGLRILVATSWTDLMLGESIAVNGVCLTVAEILPEGVAEFFLSPETLARSNLSRLRPGHFVNLERALAAGSRLSGHVVQGHVDGLARLASVSPQAEGALLELELPRALSRYCVEKGSIALDGVSLTLNRLEKNGDSDRIFITLIPHTWSHTRFSQSQPGDLVNVEVDVLAKYVEKLCQPYMTDAR